MANSVVISLNVDASGAIQNMDKVEQSILDTTSATKSLKAQLREMQAQLSNMDPEDSGFIDLSKQAAELKDRIDDAAQSVRDNAGNAFEGLSNNASTLGGRLLDLDFAGVGASAKGMAANVKNINFKALSSELGGAIKGFGALGKALLTNPIFLIGAAIAAIIVNFEKINDLLALSYSNETKSLELAKEKTAQSQQQLDAIGEQENILKLSGMSERDILKLKIAQTEEVIANTRAQIEQQKVVLAAQIATEQRAKNILTGILQFISLPLQFLAGQIDLIGEGLKKVGVISESFGLRDKLNEGINGLADMVFSPDEVQAKGEAELAAMEKQLKNLENQRAGHQLAINSIDKRAAEERKQAQEKALQEELERRKKYQAEELKLRKTGLVESQTQEVGLKASTTGLVTSEEEKRTAAERAEQERRTENAKAAGQQTLALSSNILSGVAALNELFAGKSKKAQERAFKIQKGIRIAEAVIDTYKAATSALATYPPPFGAIAAGASIAMGLANVIKIKNQKFEGGGSVSGSGSSAASVGSSSVQSGTPTFNPIDTSFLSNRPQQATAAYVLAGHVSNAQDANAKIKDLRRL